MATTKSVFSLIFILSFFSLLLLPQSYHAQQPLLKVCQLDGIYQLGDSTMDTGNLKIENPTLACGLPPYGETYFKKATGRCSDGMLIIDYIAQAAGIPFLEPYLNKSASFVRGTGVNFAVAGATALPANVLATMNISAPYTNSSLSVQLEWFSTHLNSICLNPTDCSQKLKSALFIVGEIGGNDYSFASMRGKTTEELKTMVPQVVKEIKDTVTSIIGYGGVRVIVPGHFPQGCLPYTLTTSQTTNSAAYDEFHCLKESNDFTTFHNDNLKQAIAELSTENPKASIVYADQYNAFMSAYRNASVLGFDGASVQKSCCGTGGEYNFDLEKTCATAGVPVCPKPDERISWDGVHMTQHAHQYMSELIMNNVLPKLRCT